MEEKLRQQYFIMQEQAGYNVGGFSLFPTLELERERWDCTSCSGNSRIDASRRLNSASVLDSWKWGATSVILKMQH